MVPSINSGASASLQTYIENATIGDKPDLSGIIVHIVDDKNNTIFSHASGGSAPLTKDSLAVVHSLTKIIGAIAFMQLVERNLVSLDDPSIIETLLPELAAKKILTGSKDSADGKKEWILEERKGEITPKMLMNHTYGGGHSYFNPLLNEYLKDQGTWEKANEATDPHQTVLNSPLLWQPSTHTNYGQGFDWIAVLIERLTKQSLADYLQENVFGPLGLKGIGFEETFGGDVTTREGNEGKFWPRSLKTPDGAFVHIDPPVLGKVERATAYPDGKYHTYPLGTGLVSSLADYARILTILLPSNAGVDPISGHRILASSSVTQITSPQLPPHIRSDARIVPTAVPEMFYPADLQAPHMDPKGSYGLGCGVQGENRMLQDGKRGRSKGSIYWYGAANTEYWVDRERGFVVVLEGNYFPWNDGKWAEFVEGVEEWVYDGLE